MNYTTMTIAQLKEEIMKRTNGDVQPFNTKTRKDALIKWLEDDDTTLEILAMEASNAPVAPKPHKVTQPMSYSRKWETYTGGGSRPLTTAQKRSLRKTATRQMQRAGVFDMDWSR